MRARRTRCALLLATLAALALATAGCATRNETSPPSSTPVLDARLSDGRITATLDALTKRASLADAEDFRATLIGRDAHSSHHVVAIRNAEAPHRHDEHDLLVVILEGHGEMLIGRETRPVGTGSIVYIPRRTRHAFSNRSAEPATAYAIYTPPFEGRDPVAAEGDAEVEGE